MPGETLLLGPGSQRCESPGLCYPYFPTKPIISYSLDRITHTHTTAQNLKATDKVVKCYCGSCTNIWVLFDLYLAMSCRYLGVYITTQLLITQENTEYRAMQGKHMGLQLLLSAQESVKQTGGVEHGR